jgi:hypothetical protein
MLNGAGGLNPDGLSLDLQFAADKTLTARKGPNPVFTRASTGTFVGSDGLIQTAAVNSPRFDHTSAGVCRGLLIEESRTNLLLQSETFGTTWTTAALNTTGTPAYLNVATAPDGATTADKLIATTSITTHQFRQSVTLVSGTTYTVSNYFKAAEQKFVSFQLFGVANGSTDWLAFFDVSTATPTAGAFNGFTSISITNAGNGWFRCTGTFTATASGTLEVRIGGAGSLSTPGQFYTGDNSSGILVWGAQLEAGGFPTSYIPTTTGGLARSADVCSYADVSSFYNPAAGTLVGDLILYTPSPSANPELFRFGSGNNRIQLGVTNVAGEAIRPFIISGGTTTYNSTQGTTVAGASRKVALTFAANDAISCLNGTLGTQDTSVTMPVSISTAFIGTSSFTGHIAAIRFYKKRLSNAKLQALTA